MNSEQIEKLDDSIKGEPTEKTIIKSCEGLFAMGFELCAFLDTENPQKDDAIIADKMAEMVIILYKLKLIFDNENQVNERIKILINK